jgi:hypothetical protein
VCGVWQPAAVPSRDPSPQTPPGRRRFADWFLRDRRTGRITLVQWPNPALWVWLVTTVLVGLGLFPARLDEMRWIAAGALIAWGADEISRGATPARRLLGLLVLGWQVYRLIS